ncbi:hypothetical protein GGE12_002807 [Rhizobium mongolense]|uniref:Uncharacterized protein n=1 Tax=Rhizobium mongolense TaxID=57676 RepID=A0A7W6RN82_9HYPH|nr:hypothetical protein [Rhizobium mongolense]
MQKNVLRADEFHGPKPSLSLKVDDCLKVDSRRASHGSPYAYSKLARHVLGI